MWGQGSTASGLFVMSKVERISPSKLRQVADVASWADEADVVIVGFGCAGASAAIEAAAAGVDTLVLERASGGGGTSAMSGGILYLGGGTPTQTECGFEDSPDEMFRYLVAATGPGPCEAKLRLFSDESVAHWEWLVEQGLRFKSEFSPEPGMEAQNDAGLNYTGGEDGWPFIEIAKAAPRGHKPQQNAAAGNLLMNTLVGAVEATATRVETDTRVETLVVDPSGCVVGVIAWKDSREIAIRARKGVLLAGGGFVLNEEMVAKHAPQAARCRMKIASDGDDGRVIRMGIAAGGEARRMDALEVAAPITPPHRLTRGILVNRRGQRFINEDTYFGRIGQESLFHQDGEMYLIVDSEVYEPNFFGLEAKWVEDDVPALEASVGLPGGSLVATMDYYNEHAARNEDPLFHKRREFTVPLDKGPWAAIDWRVEETVYATFTLGGLETDLDGRVLDVDGNWVRGLYAAGRTTNGLPSWGYASGLSLSDGTFFGRRAGRRAARGD